MSILDKFRKKKEEKPVIEPKKKEEKKPAKKVVVKDKKQLIQVYDILKEPHITEKATDLTAKNKYVFKVQPKANKIEIKRAVETLYGVKVKKVHIVHIAPKKRRLGQTKGWRHGLKRGFKKAIVTLVKGEKIEVMPK